MTESIRDTAVSDPIAIRVSSLSKVYRVWHKPWDRIKSVVVEATRRGLGQDAGQDNDAGAREAKGFRKV